MFGVEEQWSMIGANKKWSMYCYRAFHRIGQAKLAYSGLGLILCLNQVSLLPQLPQKRFSIQKWSNATLK